MTGKTLLHYEIIEKLGEGGMGEVYRARDTKLGRDVALKVLPEDMYRDPERRRRFEREARVIAALNHPNIVTIHSVEEVDDRLFLTMELVEGRTLREEITRGGASLETFFAVAVPLVDAVCSAHGQGITHRDLKPANVMLSKEGRLKVLDFGLAKLFQDSTADDDARTVVMDPDTEDGHIMGTVSYMSPEQVEGKALDGRSDIFSMGIVFYELLTGVRPFAGDSNASTISAILRDAPRPVSEIRQTLPSHLSRIIRRCLAKEPDRRYQSALDLRNELQELAAEVDSGEVDVDDRSTSEVKSATTGTGSTAPQKTVSSDSIVLPGTKRTYRRVLGLAGLVVVAAIAVIAVVNQSSHKSDNTSTEAVSGANATVGVIGFENLSDPQDTENLGRVMMGLVTTGLAESGGLNVASTAKVLAGRRQAGMGGSAFDASLARGAAREAGADVMVVGQVIRDGERMILTAELVDVASGNVRGSFKKQAASSSELFELAGAIAHDVRDLMGVGTDEGSSGEFDLARSLTDSPEAYRRYAAGEMALQQGKYPEAAASFERAIEIDSSFALAYLRNMTAQTWGGDTEKGLAYLKVGLRYIDRLPERWQVVYRAGIDFYDGDIDAAYEALLQLVESSTDVPDAYDMLGEITTHYSKYMDVRRSREYFESTLEIDPTYEVVFYHLVECYIAAQDFGALENLIERYRRINAIDPRVVGAELSLQEAQHKYNEVVARIEAGELDQREATVWTQHARCLEAIGKWDRAFELCDAVVRRNETGYFEAFAYMQRASAEIGLGKIAAAVADYEEASGRLTTSQVSDSWSWAVSIVALYRISQAFVLTHAGDLDGALAAAHKAVEIDPDLGMAYLALMRAQLRTGRTAEAEATFRDIERVRAANQNPSDAFYVLMAEAVWRAHQGDYDEALDALQRADAMPLETRNPWTQRWIEGEIRVAQGDRDGAIRAYEKILEPPSFLVSRQAIGAAFQIPFHYEIARLYEEAGRLDDARTHYSAYLERWGHADVAIPNVEDARSRLATLDAQM